MTLAGFLGVHRQIIVFALKSSIVIPGVGSRGTKRYVGTLSVGRGIRHGGEWAVKCVS